MSDVHETRMSRHQLLSFSKDSQMSPKTVFLTQFPQILANQIFLRIPTEIDFGAKSNGISRNLSDVSKSYSVKVSPMPSSATFHLQPTRGFHVTSAHPFERAKVREDTVLLWAESVEAVEELFIYLAEEEQVEFTFRLVSKYCVYFVQRSWFTGNAETARSYKICALAGSPVASSILIYPYHDH